MTLAQKFQMYQFQQNDKRNVGVNGEDDDEMNYINLVEYQSLENSARKYHILALQEIREFWNGIRNGRTKEELTRQLDHVSSLTQQTKKLYSTLLKRFPNSSIVLNLYARFTAVVIADRDYARELSEAAKDNENLQEGGSENASESGEKAAANHIEARSVGSSNTSDQSKAVMVLKKKREIMEERLDMPIRNFLRNANLFTLFFILLMAASASLSFTQIYKTNDALQTLGFVKLASRTSLQRLHLHLRKLSYYKASNETAKFAKTAKDLSAELDVWRNDVKPLYVSGPGDRIKVIVREWNGKEYTITKFDALQVSVLVEQHIQVVNETVNTFFADRTAALLSPEVRFIFDNSANIMEYFTLVRGEEIQSHYDFIILLRTALLCCKSSIAILAFVFSLVIPTFSYQSFQARFVFCYRLFCNWLCRQGRIIDLLLRLPKKPILEILTTVEEEIENIAVDEKQTVSAKSIDDNSKRWSFVLSGRYLLAILLFYIVNVVKVYFVISHVDRTVIVPNIYDVSLISLFE